MPRWKVRLVGESLLARCEFDNVVVHEKMASAECGTAACGTAEREGAACETEEAPSGNGENREEMPSTDGDFGDGVM